MLNTNKCRFLTEKVEVVGMEIVLGQYFAKQGKMSALLNTQIPTNLWQLQKLCGQLNYFRRFVPGYAQLFKPIKALMSPASEGVWTEECHKSLLAICRILKKRLQLRIAIPSLPYLLYVDASSDGASAILC